MLSVVIVICSLYAIVMLSFVIAASRMTEFNNSVDTPSHQISIIIPFRNEEEYLLSLLQSLENLEYPETMFEVILVNDASEDNSCEIVQHYIESSNITMRLLHSETLSEAPKKEALRLGILASKFDWIISTDADCEVPKNWLKTLDAFLQENQSKMVVAPVMLFKDQGMALEIIETLSLQIVTMGSFGLKKPLMNNGANLIFYKEVFKEVDGYSGNLDIASGDDLFLMEKFIEKKYKVDYLKSHDALVKTAPQTSLQQFVRQRVRWSSKTSASNNIYLKGLGLLVFITNLLIAFTLFLVLLQKIPSQVFILAFSIKLIVDLLIVNLGKNFFKTKPLLGKLMILSLIYPFVNVYIAIHSLFGGYQWKSRRFKR